MGEPAKKKRDYYERDTHYTEVLERCPECGGPRVIMIYPKKGHAQNSITKKKLRCTCACKTKPEFLYKCSKCQDTGWILKEVDGFTTGFECECRKAERMKRQYSGEEYMKEVAIAKARMLPDY